MSAALIVTTLLAAATVQDLETAATRQVAQEFERVGRRTPVRDEALSEAARAVARHALEHGARPAADLVPLTEAVSFADAWDPSPRALVIKGSPATEPLRMLATRKDLPSDAATHVGVGAVIIGDSSAVVLLFTQRRARMEKFWRTPPRPLGKRELCGVLEAPYGAPEVFVTRPDGKVDRASISTVRPGGGFCAKIPLISTGRYTLEVLGRGPKGPEVAALFFVDVGDVKRELGAGIKEPSDPNVARAMVVERINALRATHGAPALQEDPQVTRVAQAYSERMAQGGFFAHVAPEGDTVGRRLTQAGYLFRGAGENLGMASGPLAAHFGIEHSPGHRRNLLERGWRKVGIGIATREVDGDRQVILTQIFVDPLEDSRDPLGDAYRVISERRSALKLPRLVRSPVLDELARAHAKKALAHQEPRAELAGEKLHDRIFAAMDEVKTASIDFYVADSPALIDATSKAMADGRFGLVGLGAVKGDSARFGKNKYWVVVIYAATR